MRCTQVEDCLLVCASGMRQLLPLIPGDTSLAHSVGMMGLTWTPHCPPALGSPKPTFPTHHQDPIGDDFRRRHLAAKEEGAHGTSGPSTWVLL